MAQCEATTRKGVRCRRNGEYGSLTQSHECWQHHGRMLLADFVERVMKPAMQALADDIHREYWKGKVDG